MTGVAVYLKYPQPGKVKTRLAAAVGFDEAASLYSRMISLVWEKTLLPLPKDRFETWFFCDPYRPLADYEERYGKWSSCQLQVGDDLGARLTHSFAWLLDRYDEVLTIGTDCLDITPLLMEEAREALISGKDLVVGPAIDGGYYLIGLKASHPSLFEEQDWSTASVLPSTLDKAAKLGLKTHLLKALSDIDTVEDLQARSEL